MQMEENKNLNCQTEKYVENIAVIDIVNIPNQKEKKKSGDVYWEKGRQVRA